MNSHRFIGLGRRWRAWLDGVGCRLGSGHSGGDARHLYATVPRELACWVLLNNDEDPPDSGSIWGNLYDHLYQKDKQTQTRINNPLELVDLARQSPTNAPRCRSGQPAR